MLKQLSGHVRLREQYDEDLLNKELEALGMSGPIMKISNPWYCRKKGEETWLKIGESEDKSDNFPVSWETSELENGDYEILGQMHIFVKSGSGEQAIARQSIMEVTIIN
jgi:hypothetical protein